MTTQYIVGEFSALLGDLLPVADGLLCGALLDLQREAEASPCRDFKLLSADDQGYGVIGERRLTLGLPIGDAAPAAAMGGGSQPLVARRTPFNSFDVPWRSRGTVCIA